MFSHTPILLLVSLIGICVYAKTGEKIAESIYKHINECKDPPGGHMWAPLEDENSACGEGPCDYPKQWCAATIKLKCENLPPDCQKKLAEDDATTTSGASTSRATGTTASAAAKTTTSQSQGTTTFSSSSSAATTKPTTQKAAGGATLTPAATRASSGTTDAPGKGA